ncbi:hypothetical protein FRACYDRAFT_238593 [Fragilariopsis cylindrus CCMP1102]|uniref:Uncharacterized protein n=1 Tax=Fragilariopsis cylindrus CCMP1102 TaxID=635003 RepID=A0A1E7FJ10_9STRA|nr:hypothetical protein FRACYDRAFT_238593 [Fragilariopsis cylindrus CCMP1102]|eukprot:OEU18161.1 hypothetical protein FRACYDRAFT_238593 [Fragilariopsis cylindrus CCMP1102]
MAMNQNRFTESAIIPLAPPKSADQDVTFNSPAPATQLLNARKNLRLIRQKYEQEHITIRHEQEQMTIRQLGSQGYLKKIELEQAHKLQLHRGTDLERKDKCDTEHALLRLQTLATSNFPTVGEGPDKIPNNVK